MTLLDIGTGTGTLALAALQRWPAAHVIGVDPSQAVMGLAAAAAREAGTAERLRLERGEAGSLPLADQTVDVAVSSFVIQLVPSRAAAVREALRVLRPGGTFASLTWQAEDGPFEPESAFELAVDELEIDLPAIDGPDPRPYPSPVAAAAELRRAGFRQVRAREEWLEHRYAPASYLDVLEHWIEDEAFATLDGPMRRRLRAAVLQRLEQLDPAALVWRRPLVSVVGRRPG